MHKKHKKGFKATVHSPPETRTCQFDNLYLVSRNIENLMN